MSKLEKLIARLLGKPADFTWRELQTLMKALGYELRTTGGSGRKFLNPSTGATLFMHEPHPSSILKAYQVRAVVQFLGQEGRLP
jgi:hypothetical protein